MTDDLIEQAAEAAYRACLSLRSDPHQHTEPWASLPEWWRRTFRAQARAVLAVAEAQR